MPSRIDIGPEGGPFVEIDEENGDLVIRVPNDQIDFANSDIVNVGNIAGIADDPHGQESHNAEVLHDGENFDGQGTSSLTNLAAVETADATINSRNANLFVAAQAEGTRLEHDVETNVAGATASSNNDFSDQNFNAVSVSFASAFSATPSVFVERHNFLSGEIDNAANPSTTGFDIRVYNYSTDDHSDASRDVSWAAVGDE